MKNKFKKGLIGFLVMILIIPLTFGFGVTQPGTIFLSPGESKIIDFSVQNGGGATDDVIAILSVAEGKDVVELIEDNSYFVPASGETKAKVKIKVPYDASPEDKWNVKLTFRAAQTEPSILSGMVALSYGVDIKFDVVASEPVKELPPVPTAQATRVSYNGVYAVIVIAAIAIIIYFLTRKKKTIPKNIGKKRK